MYKALQYFFLYSGVAVCKTASACLSCDSERAAQVRASVFGQDFWLNISLMLLPFLVFLFIAACMYVGWPFFAEATQKKKDSPYA